MPLGIHMHAKWGNGCKETVKERWNYNRADAIMYCSGTEKRKAKNREEYVKGSLSSFNYDQNVYTSYTRLHLLI